MQEKVAQIRNELKELVVTEDEQACIESMDEIAKDIALLALENCTGVLLRKAMDIAIAVVEFADELETE